jgi:hypothetical protein
MAIINCVVCGTPFEAVNKVTCSQECHDKFVRMMEFKYGPTKKIIRETTGEAFRVPVRDIIEKGVREQDLDQYPKWVD